MRAAGARRVACADDCHLASRSNRVRAPRCASPQNVRVSRFTTPSGVRAAGACRVACTDDCHLASRSHRARAPRCALPQMVRVSRLTTPSACLLPLRVARHALTTAILHHARIALAPLGALHRSPYVSYAHLTTPSACHATRTGGTHALGVVRPETRTSCGEAHRGARVRCERDARWQSSAHATRRAPAARTRSAFLRRETSTFCGEAHRGARARCERDARWQSSPHATRRAPAARTRSASRGVRYVRAAVKRTEGHERDASVMRDGSRHRMPRDAHRRIARRSAS